VIAQAFTDDMLKARIEDAVGFLVIDNPRRKNAVTQAMWLALPDALAWLVGNGARVVVLSGAGADFSAGADISEFSEVRRDTQTAVAYESSNSRAFRAVRELDVPVIAAIGGICFGGGFGLAAAADIRIADETARFCVPPARLGLAYPADAIGDIVLAIGQQWARRALYSAETFAAALMFDIGFISEMTSPGEHVAAATALAAKIAVNAPLSVKASKLAIRASLSADPDLSRAALEAGAITFDSCDYAEGRRAFTERRPPVFEGK
jgi:enoyl-CoA hydratase/carnithine racemase